MGGGIFQDGTTATLQNTIVAGNTAVDCDGAVVSFDNNLDSDNTCNLVAPGDLPGVDPLLGPLANNGGPTQTHALTAGSPAIDAGDDGAAPAADQRGFPRARASDIGAFEFRGADVDGDGFEAESVGGTDCDDTDPAIFPGATDVPGDGIDQDCDGADASKTPSSQQTLRSAWNTAVFTGADGTSPAALAAAIGPRVDSIWHYDATLQVWLVHRPGGLAILNTYQTMRHTDALFIRLIPGDPLALTWPDLIAPGPRTRTLAPGWTFIAYAGPSGAPIEEILGAALAAVSGVFRFDAIDQRWLGFFPSGPAFVNAFTTVDRLTALFIHNPTGAPIALTVEELPAAASAGAP